MLNLKLFSCTPNDSLSSVLTDGILIAELTLFLSLIAAEILLPIPSQGWELGVKDCSDSRAVVSEDLLAFTFKL